MEYYLIYQYGMVWAYRFCMSDGRPSECIWHNETLGM